MTRHSLSAWVASRERWEVSRASPPRVTWWSTKEVRPDGEHGSSDRLHGSPKRSSPVAAERIRSRRSVGSAPGRLGARLILRRRALEELSEFVSAIVGKECGAPHALEVLVVGSFLRGLSVRDVEAALDETFGQQVIGKSTVARICRGMKARRDLVAPCLGDGRR